MEEDDESGRKEEPNGEGAGELGSFLAWASAEGRDSSVKREIAAENGEDALLEKEERRLAAADDASDDDARSKRHRAADSLSLPKAEKVEAEIAGLKKEIAAEEKSLEAAMAKIQAPATTKAEKDESDEEIDLAAMQRWRRLEDELSDDGNEMPVKAEISNVSDVVASA
jgi:Xaa-Pro aminopeptidase